MKRENRNIKVTIRLTANEFLRINRQFEQSSCTRMSQYIRTMLLKGKITLNYHNQSLDNLVEELKSHRKELNALGNNFNQVVKKLNGCQETHEIVYWTSIAAAKQQSLLGMVDDIKKRMGSISDVWLQKL